MKIFCKLVPLMIVGGILTGCGKSSNQAQNTGHSQSQQAATHRIVKRSTVKRDLNHDQNGAKQQRFNNSQQAKHSVQKSLTQSSQSAASDGLPTVDLGSGIEGEEDHGAGQTYVSFKMGNWKVMVHGNDVNQRVDTAKKRAKSLVTYFQNHSLPIPHDHGQLIVNTGDNSAQISWQEGRTVNNFHGNVDHVLQKAIALK